MNNIKNISKNYYDEFYGIKKNINIVSFKTITLTISMVFFVFFLAITILNAISFTSYLTEPVREFMIAFITKKHIANAYLTLTLTFESAMIISTLALQKEKITRIKSRLSSELDIKPCDEIQIFKQKWLCKRFKCFPHELSEKAIAIHNQNQILKTLEKIEPFSIKTLGLLIFNNDAKTRINGWLIAFISLMVGLFISKQKDVSIDLLFMLIDRNFIFFDAIVSISLISFVWMIYSIWLPIKDLAISSSNKSNTVITDMIKSSHIK